MRLCLWVCIFFPVRSVAAETFRVDGVEFVCRAPAKVDENSRIMVLFGGRNWPGEQTLKTYRFDALADKHHLFLLSPSFVKGDYWIPENGSGKALTSAVSRILKKYKLKPQKLLFYGYSAGGQCANLFYAWMPDEVESWGAHACGVYYTKKLRNPVPALLTCGVEDKERLEISRLFLYRYRESGGALLWKSYQNSGHDLNHEALELARLWFDAILSGKAVREYGEDDTRKIVPESGKENVEIEFRNPLFDAGIRELWRK